MLIHSAFGKTILCVYNSVYNPPNETSRKEIHQEMPMKPPQKLNSSWCFATRQKKSLGVVQKPPTKQNCPSRSANSLNKDPFKKLGLYTNHYRRVCKTSKTRLSPSSIQYICPILGALVSEARKKQETLSLQVSVNSTQNTEI